MSEPYTCARCHQHLDSDWCPCSDGEPWGLDKGTLICEDCDYTLESEAAEAKEDSQ